MSQASRQELMTFSMVIGFSIALFGGMVASSSDTWSLVRDRIEPLLNVGKNAAICLAQHRLEEWLYQLQRQKILGVLPLSV